MDDLVFDQSVPELDRPYAIVAFEGWNDAGSAASGAARYLSWKLGGKRFAHIDSEGFFDYTDVRPNVRAATGGDREIQWPRNQFFSSRGDGDTRDLIILIGTEPSLRWRAYTDILAGVFRDLGVELVVSLGALLADVPHTRAARVTGTAQRTDVAERLGIAPSRYEGPTGIVGVLHQTLAGADVDTASFWANVPHYLTSDRNPPATLALLQRIESLLDRRLELGELESAAKRFASEVDQALTNNPEADDYVRQLEEAYDAGQLGEIAEQPLPPAADIIGDVERFLRGDDAAD